MIPSENKYAECLEEINNADPKIQIVALTDLTGILKGAIRHANSVTPVQNLDELQTFLGTAIAQSHVQMGALYQFIHLYTVIVEYERGIVLLAPTGTSVLIVLVQKGANIGFIRHKMIIVAKKLQKLETELEIRSAPVRKTTFEDRKEQLKEALDLLSNF